MDRGRLARLTTLLAAVEVGVGGFLHALHIPFTGHILSLNQGFILTRAVIELHDRRAAGIVSTSVAMLKSLSPVGKKLTPMLAIAIQGQLFGVGTWIAGNNFVGHCLGMALLCCWGILQPLAFFGLTFGSDILQAVAFALEELKPWVNLDIHHLGILILCLFIFKLLAGWLFVVLAHHLASERLELYEKWAQTHIPTPRPSPGANPFIAAARDLATPFFILSLILTGAFAWFAHSNHAGLVWILLRPLAVGYLIFLVLRLTPIDKVRALLQRHCPRLAQTLQDVIDNIKRP